MSKKKRNVIIVVTALLFFGALLFNLKYPLMSETSAEPGKIAQEDTISDSKADSKTDDANKTGEAVDRQEKEDQGQDKEEPVEDKNSSKPDSNTSSKSSSQSPVTNNTDNQDKVSKPKTEPKPEPKPAPTPEPKPQPKPALKPFSVPASNSFAFVEKGTPPGEAELLIGLNSSDNYEAQLNQLYNVIAPVAGSQIANEIVSYAREKTDAYISLEDRSWSVPGRTLELGSTWGSWGVSFYSWRK